MSKTLTMKVTIPDHIARERSERATEIARILAPKDTGAGARGLEPTKEPGKVGVHIPDRVFYMYYQDRGIKAFTMWELEGKTIPMRMPDGSIQFRVARDVGKRKITSRDEKGRIITSKISWRHPGLEAKHFIRRAVMMSLDEFMTQFQEDKIRECLQATDDWDEFISAWQGLGETPKNNQRKIRRHTGQPVTK